MTKGALRWTEEQLADYQKRHRNMPEKCQPGPVHDFFMQQETKPSKFRSVLTECDGIKFHSKKEARYYQQLKARIHAGEVKYFLMQVPFLLPGNVRYRVDFQEFWTDGSVHYVDVKGMRTETYKIKRRQVEALYPVRIEEA